jgi:UDP-glucose 4-epimerase
MTKRILITGATGKVGQVVIKRLVNDSRFDDFVIRALCHNRILPPAERLEIVRGSIDKRETVEEIMQDVSHVLHLATSKETPESIMDIAVKGLFWLLEASRTSETFQQFILIGGDAGMGHFHYPHPIPVTETQKHSAYQGCYALSKVLEEVMLEQYYIQYDLNACCLRAPWIMEKDDFKYHLTFGEDVFGGPRWRDMVGAEKADDYLKSQTIPIMLDAKGQPMQRNFVHVEDLATAILMAIDHPKARQETFNICMDEPIDYAKVAHYLAENYQLPNVAIDTDFHSTWLDNTKAKFLLNWRPEYDLARIIDSAWAYKRTEARIVWYPG